MTYSAGCLELVEGGGHGVYFEGINRSYNK